MPLSTKSAGKVLLELLRRPRRSSSGQAANLDLQKADFEEILRAEQPLLLRSARRMCYGDVDRAEDIVQDSIVRAWTAWSEGRFQQGTNTRAWLMRIVTNTFLNDNRQRKRWTEEDIYDVERRPGVLQSALQAGELDQPQSSLLSGLMDDSIEKALNKLPDELRLTVLLVDINGLDYAEAAAALAIPVGTVRSRLSRARIKMYNDLAEFAKDRGYVRDRKNDTK